MNYLFDLRQKAVILDFNHTAMSKVLSGHTTMSDIPENRMIEIKIMNMLPFCQTCDQFFI